jgi:hypothetical protein
LEWLDRHTFQRTDEPRQAAIATPLSGSLRHCATSSTRRYRQPSSGSGQHHRPWSTLPRVRLDWRLRRRSGILSSGVQASGLFAGVESSDRPVRSQSAVDLATTFHNRQSQRPELQVRSTSNTARSSKHPIWCSRSTHSNPGQRRISRRGRPEFKTCFQESRMSSIPRRHSILNGPAQFRRMRTSRWRRWSLTRPCGRVIRTPGRRKSHADGRSPNRPR